MYGKNTGIMLGTYVCTLNNFQSYRNCEGLPRLESDCCKSGVSRIWSCKSGVPRNYTNLCIAVPKFSFRIAISSGCSCSMINKCSCSMLNNIRQIFSEYWTLGQNNLNFRIASDETLNYFSKCFLFYLICQICQ